MNPNLSLSPPLLFSSLFTSLQLLHILGTWRRSISSSFRTFYITASTLRQSITARGRPLSRAKLSERLFDCLLSGKHGSANTPFAYASPADHIGEN